MHNLVLGTAKSMFKLWMEQGLLNKKDIQTTEKRIKEFEVGTGLGRLPHKISANYGCYIYCITVEKLDTYLFFACVGWTFI